jgi:hypothetical protein
MLNEILVVVIKTFDRIQCPFNLFITHALKTGFKQKVIGFAIAQTWALRIH